MRKIALFVLSILAAAPALAQSTIEFKGVPLRASEEQLLKVHPGFVCRAGTDANARLCVLEPVAACQGIVYASPDCVAAQSYGGARFERVFARFVDGVGLASISVFLPERSFQQVTAALQKKLGAPSDQAADKVRTKAGVELTNHSYTWTVGSDSLRATRFTSTISSSAIHILTPESTAAFARSRDQAVKAAAGNL